MGIIKDVVDKCRDPGIAITSAKRLLHRRDHSPLDVFKRCLADLRFIARQMVQKRDSGGSAKTRA